MSRLGFLPPFCGPSAILFAVMSPCKSHQVCKVAGLLVVVMTVPFGSLTNAAVSCLNACITAMVGIHYYNNIYSDMAHSIVDTLVQVVAVSSKHLTCW